jgi:hypothetical protein
MKLHRRLRKRSTKTTLFLLELTVPNSEPQEVDLNPPRKQLRYSPSLRKTVFTVSRNSSAKK